MFNIIETLQNCFTRELLPDYLSSKVHFTFQRKLLAAIFSGKLFRGSIINGQCCPHGQLTLDRHEPRHAVNFLATDHHPSPVPNDTAWGQRHICVLTTCAWSAVKHVTSWMQIKCPNCNCNWRTCIVPPTRRLRAHNNNNTCSNSTLFETKRSLIFQIMSIGIIQSMFEGMNTSILWWGFFWSTKAKIWSNNVRNVMW